MADSSFYFRNYVECGLAEVAEQRKMRTHNIFKPTLKPEHIGIAPIFTHFQYYIALSKSQVNSISIGEIT